MDEGGVKGLSSRIYLKVEMSTSGYDSTLKEILHWYRDHVAYMRKEAAGKGWKPEEAVANRVYVTRYNNERSGKLTVSIPGHRTLPITSARELIQLVGQRCLDAFVMKVPATTWITPRGGEDLPPPVQRVSGGNREPIGKDRNEKEATEDGEKREKETERKEATGNKGEKEKPKKNTAAEEKGREEESPEKTREGGERDVSLEGSPVLDISGEEEKKEEKRGNTFKRKAKFDWNEGRYV